MHPQKCTGNRWETSCQVFWAGLSCPRLSRGASKTSRHNRTGARESQGSSALNFFCAQFPLPSPHPVAGLTIAPMSFAPELPIFQDANVSVPAVAPEDLRKLSEIYAQMNRQYPQGGVSLNIRACESAFRADADLLALWLRYSSFAILKMLLQLPGAVQLTEATPQAIKADLVHEPIPDYILEVAAKFPMVGPCEHGQGQFYERGAFVIELEKA